jgi:hypothetical protein
VLSQVTTACGQNARDRAGQGRRIAAESIYLRGCELDDSVDSGSPENVTVSEPATFMPEMTAEGWIVAEVLAPVNYIVEGSGAVSAKANSNIAASGLYYVVLACPKSDGVRRISADRNNVIAVPKRNMNC